MTSDKNEQIELRSENIEKCRETLKTHDQFQSVSKAHKT